MYNSFPSNSSLRQTYTPTHKFLGQINIAHIDIYNFKDYPNFLRSGKNINLSQKFLMVQYIYLTVFISNKIYFFLG